MGHAIRLDAIDELPSAPAADVKKRGWRQIARDVAERGRIVVTNHKDPEAVILSVEEYRSIMQALAEANVGAASPVEALRQRFKARLTTQSPEARDAAYRDMFADPAPLDGSVRAGDHF